MIAAALIVALAILLQPMAGDLLWQLYRWLRYRGHDFTGMVLPAVPLDPQPAPHPDPNAPPAFKFEDAAAELLQLFREMREEIRERRRGEGWRGGEHGDPEG